MATVTHNGNTHTVSLMPSAEAVLNVMRSNPDGACPRTFADHDIYRYGARIHDLRKAGFRIVSERCTTHLHTRYLEAYRVEGWGPV